MGIRHPWEADKLCWVLTGTDFAVATSGTYERGYHVIDPYRGEPATALRSASGIPMPRKNIGPVNSAPRMSSGLFCRRTFSWGARGTLPL